MLPKKGRKAERSSGQEEGGGQGKPSKRQKVARGAEVSSAGARGELQLWRVAVEGPLAAAWVATPPLPYRCNTIPASAHPPPVLQPACKLLPTHCQHTRRSQPAAANQPLTRPLSLPPPLLSAAGRGWGGPSGGLPATLAHTQASLPALPPPLFSAAGGGWGGPGGDLPAVR